ncbi:MAG: YolD-like family protein [Lachnospiraceae bacterium]|nr:YolD-like family protein [Lachnospiraceae bacterium]
MDRGRIGDDSRRMYDPSVVEKYGDILNERWDGVRRHPRADSVTRAAQFSPFAALSGYEDEISETARLTDSRAFLTEESLEEIGNRLQRMIETKEEATVVYFKSDDLKSGGSYESVKSRISKYKSFEREIVFENGLKISIDDIHSINF